MKLKSKNNLKCDYPFLYVTEISNNVEIFQLLIDSSNKNDIEFFFFFFISGVWIFCVSQCAFHNVACFRMWLVFNN